MWKVVKNGMPMTVRDKHQLDAFLNNGWKLADAEPIKGTLEENETETKSYTKTEINRMPVDELRKVALETGVDGAETMTGAELKERLIATFDL